MRETDENEWNVYVMRELLYQQVKNSSIIISHQVISWYIHIYIYIYKCDNDNQTHVN